MQDRVTIETPFCEQTVLQQVGGYAELSLEGTYERSDPRNYPVIRVVCERTEQTELYQPLACEDGRWTHTLRLPVGMHRVETGVALSQAGFNPFYLGNGDMLRGVFVGEIFAIAGQSNAAGYGKGEIRDLPQYGVSVFDGAWRTAAHPIGQIRANSANPDALNCGHSAWLALGKRILAQSGSPVGLVPAALNGSGMRDWLPGKPLFESLVTLCLRTGAANLIWYQGCTDTDDPSGYAGRLERMLRELQNRLNGVSVTVVQISGTTNERRDGRGWRTVREAQRAAAVRFGAALVPTYDLTRYCDDIHLGPADNLLLAERVANRFLARQQAGVISAKRIGDTVEVTLEGVLLVPGQADGVTALDEAGEVLSCQVLAKGSTLFISGGDICRARRVTLAFDRICEGAALRDAAGEVLPYFDVAIE